MSRLTRLRDFKTNPDTTQTNLYNRQYSYNQASNISQIKIGNQTKDYNYDLIDRLTQVISSNAQQNENYGYDGVGNRLTSHLSTTYQYAAFNRLNASQQASFVYDNNGNMTSRTDSSGTTQYIWDFENRLRQVIKPDGTSVNYKYNALGQRTERYVGANSTKFTYDGQDVLLDVNSDGSFVKYVNGLGIDDKIRQTVNGQAQYFVQDHLGSTNALTDATGNVISSASYDSFGNASGNLATRYGYTGREKDTDTGLHYYRARWYDSNLGRFLSEDPIGFEGGDINLFAYVGNNSLNFIDPEGLSVLIKLAKFIEKQSRLYLIDTGKKLTTKQAQNVRRNGGNIIVEGNDSQRVAKQVETGAFKNDRSAGKQLKHDAHGDEYGFLPHHQTNKKDGHTFYKGAALIFAPNILNLSESSCTTNIQFASAIAWDALSLIDPIGVTEGIDAYTGADGGEGGLIGVKNFVKNTYGATSLAQISADYLRR
jgi:RHS repeat-associated protein